MTTDAQQNCAFCAIVSGDGADAAVVFRDDLTLAFLDRRPVFPGHTLLVPRRHVDTLPNLPDDLIEPLFSNARLIAAAVQDAMTAEGTFVAMNNTISQSVPHLHVHVVPRRRGDGLRGFFWPRRSYRDDAHIEATRAAIESAAARLSVR